MDDEVIHALVNRLGRPHPSGGTVIERAAIIAAGADFASVVGWITDHDGVPEERIAAVASGGLHGPRLHHEAGGQQRAPLRYVLPAGTLR